MENKIVIAASSIVHLELIDMPLFSFTWISIWKKEANSILCPLCNRFHSLRCCLPLFSSFRLLIFLFLSFVISCLCHAQCPRWLLNTSDQLYFCACYFAWISLFFAVVICAFCARLFVCICLRTLFLCTLNMYRNSKLCNAVHHHNFLFYVMKTKRKVRKRLWSEKKQRNKMS